MTAPPLTTSTEHSDPGDRRTDTPNSRTPTRERRRDLGMLKSIGMTLSQVVLTTVTSVAGPGLVAGLAGIPLGTAAHRLLVEHVGFIVFPESMKDVYHLPQLAALALAGMVIAVLGALLPARSAARLTIAKVLHNE